MEPELTCDRARDDARGDARDGVDWGAFAEYFDVTAEANPAYQELLADVIGTLTSAYFPQGPILDVGAGTGNVSLALSAAFPDRQVVHVDADPRMNERAKSKAAARGAANWALREDDVLEADFAEESAGAAVSIHALYAVRDPVAAVRRIWRWLRPGGLFFACDLGASHSSIDWAWYFFASRWRTRGLRSAVQLMLRLRGLAAQTRRITRAQATGRYWTHTLDSFAETLSSAGFDVIERRAVYRGYSNLVVCRKRQA